MRCQKCGKWLSLLYKFCTSCGTAVPKEVKKKAWLHYFILLAIVALGVSVYYYSVGSGPVIMPNNVGLVSNAVFHNKKESTPIMLKYPIDKEGKTTNALVYPGQINIFVKKGTPISAVAKLAEAYQGKILTQIPKLGFYAMAVNKGAEATVIGGILQNYQSLVISAAPNFVVQGSALVDLSGTGKTNPKDIVTALISTPNPNAKIIIAQLDNFVPLGNSKDVNLKNYGSFGSTDSHGYKVYEAMKPIILDTPVMQVHVGGWPCDRMPGDLCSSAEHTVNALAATVAGAEINGQKVNINLSYNVVPRTTDPTQFATVNNPKLNSWATNQWKGYEDQLYHVLKSSDWAEKGNVVLNQSAGNGANLVDQNGKILKTKGMDISNATNDLKQKYPTVNSYVNFAGALEFESGKLKPYSNFGTGVTYVKIRADGPEGTSFAAPILTGVGYMGWEKNYDYGPDIINNAVRAFAKKTADFQKFDAATRAWFYRYVENLEQNKINANALEKKLDASTKKLIEEQSKEKIEQQKNPKPIIVTEPKIPEPPDPWLYDTDHDGIMTAEQEARYWKDLQGASPSIKIPDPHDIDLDKIDAGGQTTDPCRWGGPGCK